MTRTELSDAELIRRLANCSDGELREILFQVFQSRCPNPEEAAFHRSHFFLGAASSELESQPDEPERWSAWRIQAVAYPDRTAYGSDPGPDGFCQYGSCGECGVQVRSNLRSGLCPICGHSVSMT